MARLDLSSRLTRRRDSSSSRFFRTPMSRRGKSPFQDRWAEHRLSYAPGKGFPAQLRGLDKSYLGEIGRAQGAELFLLEEHVARRQFRIVGCSRFSPKSGPRLVSGLMIPISVQGLRIRKRSTKDLPNTARQLVSGPILLPPCHARERAAGLFDKAEAWGRTNPNFPPVGSS